MFIWKHSFCYFENIKLPFQKEQKKISVYPSPLLKSSYIPRDRLPEDGPRWYSHSADSNVLQSRFIRTTGDRKSNARQTILTNNFKQYNHIGCWFCVLISVWISWLLLWLDVELWKRKFYRRSCVLVNFENKECLKKIRWVSIVKIIYFD